MKKCYTCGTTVAFGGVSDSGYKFCNKSCHSRRSFLFDRVKSIPDEDAIAYAKEVRSHTCDICKGPGPIDIHKSLSVMSFILFTRSQEHQVVSCASCGNKDQLIHTLSSFFIGWWGIPFGLLFTPIAILTNLTNVVASRLRNNPSKDFIKYAKEKLALNHDQQSSGSHESTATDWAAVFDRKNG